MSTRSSVATQDGDVRIACDVLAVSNGVRPRVDLAVAAGMQVDRGVVTDEYLQTSAADIFAAGDVAQVPDEPGGRSTLDTLWASAEVQGRSAGQNMTGAQRRHVKNVAVERPRFDRFRSTIS